MKTKMILSMLFAALLISACGGQTPAAPAPEPVVVEAQPAVEEPAPVVEQPAPAEPVQQEQQPVTESGMMAYTAPEGLFDLEIPNGWSYTKDTDMIENTVVETYTAPDGHAFVQVLVNDSGVEVSNVLKGQITLDYMKRLYGADLRVATDVTLDDDREKLEWWSDDNGISGTTIFHRVGNFLFFYTTAFEDAYEKDYMSMLEDVNNSYFAEEE
ncbi:MAG: hypothetical protein Q7J07_06060 [Pelolinea sp.]|nr:hypothetical protein [Pelolinea sp.]